MGKTDCPIMEICLFAFSDEDTDDYYDDYFVPTFENERLYSTIRFPQEVKINIPIKLKNNYQLN